VSDKSSVKAVEAHTVLAQIAGGFFIDHSNFIGYFSRATGRAHFQAILCAHFCGVCKRISAHYPVLAAGSIDQNI